MNKDQNFTIDFLGIGAAKSGTSWVAKCLSEHPDVQFSFVKEVYFFNKKGGVCEDRTEWNYKKGFEWYQNQFPQREIGKIVGEFSVTYLYDEIVPELIKKHFPNVKLIVSLRNPKDMVYSLYHMDKENFPEKQATTFEETIKAQPEYLRWALYYEQLRRYFDRFSKKNILVILFDDIKNNPKEVIRRVFEFLGVDSSFEPLSLNKVINPAAKTQNKYLAAILVVPKLLRKLGMESVISFMKRIGFYQQLQTIYANINTKQYKYEPMNPETERKLKEFFLKDIEKLEQLIGVPLDNWK